MEWLALAVFASVVLYLVDKNQKWRIFGKIIMAASGVFIAASIGLFLYMKREDKIANRNRECAARVRAAYPGAYDDLDDATLTEKTLAKYPNCRIPANKCDSGDVFDQAACEDAERKQEEKTNAQPHDVPDSLGLRRATSAAAKP